MTDKKYIQPQGYITTLPKQEAIQRVKEYVEGHIDEFKDGEIVSIAYKGDGDLKEETLTTSAVVRISGNSATIEALVSERDTMKVVESQEEPTDKKALWLVEEEDGGNADFSNLREQIKSLKETIRLLKGLVNKHEYALNNTLAGGDIVENSMKFDLENSDQPEEPDDADGIVVYGDGPVDDFDLYIGNLPLSDAAYITEESILYRYKRYPIRLRMFNAGKERVRESDDYELQISLLEPFVDIDSRRIIYSWSEGYVSIGAHLDGPSGETLSKQYTIYFSKNEEPDYVTYAEPNVHHNLQKSAKDFATMVAYGDYLCVGEMCWCEAEEAMFLKARGANGNIRYFKLNGGGGGEDIPTGTTRETVTYTVTDGILTATSSDDSVGVFEGVLTLVGEVDANGVLRLIDQ